MKYRLFLIIATSVVLGSTTSCSWDNEFVDSTDGDQKASISFNVNVGTLPNPEVSTRGYTTSSSESGYTFNGDEYVAVGLTHPSGSEVIKQYLVGAGNSGGNSLTYKKEADGTTTGNTFDWYSTTETGVSIRAWSDGVSTAASTPVVDPDGHTFTVETTQSGNVKELLYSPANSYSYTTSAINIPLYHQLSRIVVTIIRENSSNAVSSLTIGHNSNGNRVPITGTFTKPTGTGVNYGTWSVASEATQSAHWGVITPKAETAGSVYSAVVIPGGATEYPANTRLFNITIGSESFAYKVPTGGLTLEAGKQYNYTITVENMGITVTSNITDWNAAVPGTDFTHGDGLAFSRSVKMNPLWYVAEYNVASSTSFATTDNAGAWYKWATAMTNFSANRTASSYDGYENGNVSISGFTWHLPSLSEWKSITPTDNIWGFSFDSESNCYQSTSTVKFGYNSETKTVGVAEKSLWHKVSSTEMHAIRFLGTLYCSAWIYAWSGSTLTISATLIDPISDDGTGLAAKNWYNNYWSSTTWGNDDIACAVQRRFYARGHNGNKPEGTWGADWTGTRGFYWSTTDEGTSSNPETFYFYNGFAGWSEFDKAYLFPVRLFRDN